MRISLVFRNIAKCFFALVVGLLSLEGGVVLAQHDPVKVYYTPPGAAAELVVSNFIEITYCATAPRTTVVGFSGYIDGSLSQDSYDAVFKGITCISNPSVTLTPGIDYNDIGGGLRFINANVPNEVYEATFDIEAYDEGTWNFLYVARTITVEITKSSKPNADIVEILPYETYAGSDMVLNVKNPVSGVSYLWMRNNDTLMIGEMFTVNREAGTYPYRLRATLYQCQQDNNFQVTFNPNPSVSGFSDLTVCNGDAISLSSNPSGGTVPYTYSWTSTSAIAIDPALQGLQNPTIANAVSGHSGDYKIVVTDAKGCKGENTTKVEVKKAVDAGKISGGQRICEGTAPKVLKSTAPASGGDGLFTYLWKQSTDGGSTWHDADGTNDELTYTPPSDLSITTQYKRTVTNSCGSAETTPVTVTVDKKVVLTVGGPYSTCPDVATFLNGSISGGVNTGTWSVVDGSGSFDDPTKLNAEFTPGAGLKDTDVRLKLVSDKPAAPSVCPAVEDFVIVKVHPNGKASYTFPTEVCTSASEFPLDITPVNGTYTPNTYNHVMPFKPSDFNNGDTYTFKYNGVLDANGCAIDEDITISITSPQKFTITAPDVKYCANGKGVTIEVDGSESGVTYELWENGATTGRTYTGDGNAFTFDDVKGDGSKFTVRATRNGCYIDMNGDVTLQEIPKIQDNTISSTENSICKGGDIVLTGTQPTGGEGSYTYLWQKSEDGGATWQDIGTTKDIGTIAVGAETQFRRFVYSGQCELLSTEVTVNVTTPINPGELNPVAEPVCNGATVTITNKTDASINNYQWEISDDGSTYAPIAGATEKDLTNCPPLTVYKYYFRRMSSDGPGGCPDARTNVIEVNVLKPLSVSLTGTPPDCNGDDGTLLAAVVGGKADYHYSWYQDGNPLSLPDQASVLTKSADKYTVTVHDGCGDNATSIEYNLTQPTAIKGDISSVTNILGCYADKTGEFTITVTGGTAPYTLTWGSDVQTGVTSTHIYTGQPFVANGKVQIVDNKGCQGESDDVNITQPDLVEISLVGKQAPSCNNDDGHIEVKGTGGTGPGTYTFTLGTDVRTNATQEIFGTLGYGDYTIYIEDANGCPATNNYIKENLPEPTPVMLEAEGLPVTDCPGTPTGGIKLTISGGTGTYEYYSPELGGTWEPVTGNITGQPKGTYYIKVRDVNTHCESPEKEVKIEEPNALNFTATPNTVNCHNSTNGEIVISGIAGGTGSNYQLFIDDKGVGVHDGTVPYDVNGTSHVFGSLAPATYTITLTDGVCNVSKDVTIDAPPAITLTLDEVGKIICFNGFEPKATVKFTVNGGTGELKYHFSGLKTYSGKAEKGTQTVAEVGLGTFELTIEDASGCKITHPNPIEVTMGDAFRLETTHPIVKETLCAESTDGSATARVRGGSGLYYYELVRLTPPISEVRYPDFGGTAEKEVIFAGLAKGEYQIRAYDMNVVGGCVQASERFEVDGPEEVNFTENFEPIRCNGDDATFTVVATGGTGEYVIELYKGSTLVDTKTGSGPAVFTINAEGDYYAIVKDTKNCGNLTTSTHSVDNPAKVQFAATNAGNVTCAGGKNGIIRISGLTGGNGEYWYSLNDGESVKIDDPSVDKDVNVPAGKWDIKVFDGNGCPADPASYSIDITEPAPLKIEYKFDNLLCSTTGELKAILKGGSGSYQVSVDNSVWTDIVGNEYSFGSVSGGTYTLYVRDALDHDCSVPHDTTFETPKALQLDVPLTLEQSPSCQQIGRLVVKTSGGMATVQYKLYKEGVPLPVQENGTGIFEVKDGGDYYVEITDGCSTIQSPAGTDRVHIDQVPYVTINGVNIVEAIKCKGDFARIKVDATGGTGELYYALWNNSVNPAELIQENAAGDNIFSNLKANPDYMIIVRDEYGCADKTLFAVDEPEAMLEWSYVRPFPPTNLTKTDGYIHFKVKGGEAPYTVTFTPEGGTPQTVTETDSMMMFVFDNLGANVYRVNVTDGRGCTLDTSFVLQPMNVKHWGQHVSCFGANDGKVYAVITGNPPYELMLRDMKNLTVTYTDFVFESNTKLAPTGIQDTFVFSGIPAGEYNLYVGDRNSMTPISYNVDIFEPGELQASIVEEIPPICAMGGTGSVKIDVSGSRTYDKSHIDVLGTEPTYVVKWQNETTGETGEEQTNSEGTITVSGLNPGVIKFTVTTNRGCGPVEREVDFPIIEPIVVTTNVLQESSYGAGNGLIEANATGDNPIVTYHLLDKDGNLVATSAIGLFSNVSEGKYVVKAEDDLTCPGYSDTIYIRGTDVVVDDITPATCFGENQGAFKFHIEHGFPRFKSVSVADASGNTVAIAPEMALYSCNEPIAAENLLAGDYTITIVDSLNNIITHTVTIGQPDKLIIDATLTAPDCASNGSIALTVVGGVAPYTMEWAIDEGALEPLSSSTIDIVQGGTYRVVVTDANNCTAEWSQYVAPAESITLALEEVSNPTCFGGDNGRIAVEAANDGSSMYQYLLEKDGTLINITDNGVFENLSKGDYKVVVQNINTGCSQSFSYTLVDGAEAINIAFDGFTGKLNCPSDADGYATAVVTGGSGSYTYVWPQLGESTSSVSGLTPGTYEVIVADDLGCTATASYTIDGPKPFVFDKATRTEAKCRNSAIPANLGGKLSVGLVEGGTAPYSFYLVDETNHSIREGQPNFTGLGAGIYEVWVEDANGCRDMYYDTVLISPINDFEIGAMDTTVCFTNEVELKANVILGDVYSGQPLKYSWWSEANAANVSPDATGETYPLEGLDVNVYRYKLRVSQEGGDRCYVEKWFDVGVYPKIDIHVPLYVSSVQNDTILSILFNQEYNVDVSTSTFDYNTSFEWKPSGVFTRGNSWNSSIFMTPEKYEELKQTYPHRFKTLRDPQTKRDGDFFLVDVVATTDVGCQDSLTLYTKIVNKLYLANVFSPNGDGRNDIWKLPKEYLFPDLEIEIFNRWGALVWSAAGDKAARGWDGRTNNGKVLPIGTYWYVIKFNINSSEWKPLTGSVTIVK